MPNIYLVGGAVRDHYLGLKYKDLDYVIVGLNNFEELKNFVRDLGCKIVVSTPQYGAVRAIHPSQGGVDFVLPRLDFNQDGRQSKVKFVQSIEEDLARRDFKMNAMALEVDTELYGTGNLIDPFNGIQYIQKGIISFVGNPYERIAEDELRILRAVRFAITKNFKLDDFTEVAILGTIISDKVSSDRIFSELNKMFQVSNTKTLKLLEELNLMYILDRVKLKAST